MPAAPLDVAVLHGQAGRGRRVLELPAAEVAVEGGDVVREVGLQEVEAAVAVVVAEGQAHPRLHVAHLAVGHAALDRHVA